MASSIVRILILAITVVFFVTIPAGAADNTLIELTVSEVCIEADDSVKRLGYTVNGDKNLDRVIVSYSDVVVVDIPSLPEGMDLKTTVVGGDELIGCPLYLSGFPQDEAISIRIQLSLIGTPVNPPTPDNPPSGEEPGYPDAPDYPDTPETPSEPENPPTDDPGTDEPTNPDTLGSDEPNPNEPYTPILPPADSVYNLAGFIPLGAGALLLFLAIFWKRKVYRILNSHAKKHGEKPEKEHLKEIADAIIKLVRDEGRYPEWKKNSDVAKRLSSDIVSVLDEMNYARAVPRGALVAEILKAAKGRINRHRL